MALQKVKCPSAFLSRSCAFQQASQPVPGKVVQSPLAQAAGNTERGTLDAGRTSKGDG
jgi:hypothetical protein